MVAVLSGENAVAAAKQQHQPDPLAVITPGETDPVCGMTVDPRQAAGTVEHRGRTYYFCSVSCAQKFRADPERYLQGGPSIAAMAPAGASVYTCPMRKSCRIIPAPAPSAAWPWSR